MTVAVAVLFSAFLASGTTVGPAENQQTASAGPAARLAGLLESRQADAAATEDPNEPGRFIAALRFPGQLLVVTARCKEDAFLRYHATQGDPREVYTALHSCAVASTKFFVQDMGADGLRSHPARDVAPDIVYELASRQILLDGDWRKQELDRAGYASVAEKLDARYSRLLTILLERLERSPSPGGAGR